MKWLDSVVDELEAKHPKGQIVVSSGVSPSGTYHLGTLREVLTAEVICRELVGRGRKARHIHVVDDYDVFRKVPKDVPSDFEKYLGKPLCEVPAPDGRASSYADYFLDDLVRASKGLHLGMEIVRANVKYREGFFVPAIEKALQNIAAIREILIKVSGHKLSDQWSPIQILEDGYLKNRRFISIDTANKTLIYEDKDGKEVTTGYSAGEVKLNWRIDWPARWWLLGVSAEPFGRDHATKGGSYDTGVVIAKEVFGAQPPIPVPYDFINRTGDTKKMSKSAGNTITAADLLEILPPELVWFFVLRFAPGKLLYFDTGDTLMRLFDEFSELLAKEEGKSDDEKHLLKLCLEGVDNPTVSSVPFTHLVASYQSALKDVDRTVDVINRTEHTLDKGETSVVKRELRYIDKWLKSLAPPDVKFELREKVDPNAFDDSLKEFLADLAVRIESAPEDADGRWFHGAIYELKEKHGLSPKEAFQLVYEALIGQDHGPRAGWFLSILPRDWLIRRLRLED